MGPERQTKKSVQGFKRMKRAEPIKVLSNTVWKLGWNTLLPTLNSLYDQIWSAFLVTVREIKLRNDWNRGTTVATSVVLTQLNQN